MTSTSRVTSRFCSFTGNAAAQSCDFLLGPGDLVSISNQNADLSIEARVRSRHPPIPLWES
jgi:hypothetical protein